MINRKANTNDRRNTMENRTALLLIKLVLSAAMCAAPILANSANTPLDESINTARPSFSGPATTLEKGHWQWEGGYQYTSNDDAGSDTRTHTVPALFLRLGISEGIELNLGWAGYSDVQTNGAGFHGTSDLSVGAAYQLTADDTALAMSAFSNLSLPIGSDDFSTNDVDPSLGIAWTYSPTYGPDWFGTVFMKSVSESSERVTEIGTAIGFAFSYGERLGSYVEYFSVHSDAADSAHSINGGFTFLVNHNLQLDIYAGGGLNRVANDIFLGSGIAYRF